MKAEVKLKADPDIRFKGGAFHEKKTKNIKTNQGGPISGRKRNIKNPGPRAIRPLKGNTEKNKSAYTLAHHQTAGIL